MAATPLTFEHIKVGPEVEAFAIQLDDCLSSGFGAAETRRRVLRLVNDYYEYATTQASSLRRPPRGNDPETNYNSIVDSGSRAQHASRWEHEAQTWDLLRRLLPLRYPAPADDRAPPHSTQLKSGSASSGTNAGIWQDFLDAEPSAMERLAVLQWLQHNASTEPEASNNTTTKNQMLGRGTGAVAGHHGWIHTKSSIKLRKRLVGVEGPMDPNDAVVKEVHTSETGSPLVTQLDPDAVTRQGRQLQPRDQESERASWRACFEHLRRGSSVDAIRDWCAERDEMWRAAALSVLPLSSATKEADGGVVLTESDADALVLWRRVCFQLCRKGGSSDVYERAVYGALAGDIQSVESVCSSWDDTLFAHYNSLVRSQFDSYLVRQRASSASTAVCHAFPTPELAQSSGGAGGTGGTASIVAKVAQALESVSSPTRPPPSDEVLPIKVLQAAIIAQDLDRLLYEQGVVLSYESTPISRSTSHLMPRTGKNPTNAHKKRHVGLDDHHGLRILAHVTFITSILDRLDLPGRAASGRQAAVQDPHRLQNQENILIGYVSFLRLSGLEDLVPLYCSELQEPRVYEILHNNLIHVDDEIARSQQLELMRKAGLDPLKFVNAQFDLSFAAVPPARGPKFTFSILLPREQLVDFGRQIRTDFLGDDPDKLDHIDDVLIKTLEWQVLVEDAWPGLFSAIMKLYKYFLVNGRLGSARALANRVSCVKVIRERLEEDDEDFDPLWQDDALFWAQQLKDTPAPDGLSPFDVAAQARITRELESLIIVLDALETLATLAIMARQDPTPRRDFWTRISTEVKKINTNIRPILRNWLLGGIQDQEGDDDLCAIRDIYLCETVLAYITALHFAGSKLSRDYLLECMDLAATVAEKGSDVAASFKAFNRLSELVEAFAAASKALAIISNDAKSSASTNTKKLRETGWNASLWSVPRQ